MQTEDTCPICGEAATVKACEGKDYNVLLYMHGRCGDYYVDRREVLTMLKNPSVRAEFHPERLQRLLVERIVKGERRPLLIFGNAVPEEFDEAAPLGVQDLLSQWPSSFPDRLERSFIHLARSSDSNLRVGRAVKFGTFDFTEYIPFAQDQGEAGFFIEALKDYGWIEYQRTTSGWTVTVTPTGWAKFEETQKREDKKNPVFVAMWFGGKKRAQDMRNLFDETIKLACWDAGWDAIRVDSEEHNQQIMDRVIYHIRRAPFVIAELSESKPDRQNAGVYYEAGLAHGLGKTVIYCRPEEQEAHFDVAGINQVVWSNTEQLKVRLKDRILGTKDRGLFVNKE